MKTEIHVFRCDLCGDQQKREKPIIPEKWKRLTFDYTDFAGHTETQEKHICEECVAKITKTT